MIRGSQLAAALLATALLFLALGASPALATHISCGETITQDTTLDSDLTDCPGDGIVIGADNITLDLGGHTVDGTAGTGCCTAGINNGFPPPYSGGYDGVTVENGSVSDFPEAVSLFFASRNLVRELHVTGSGNGIVVIAGGNHRIEDNSISHVSGEGIELNSASNRVTRNSVSASGEGITSDGAFGNEIERNLLFNNGKGVFVVDSGGDNHVYRNLAFDNLEGIVLVEDLRDRVEQNLVYGNVVGIRLAGFTSNEIVGNRAFANRQDGILIEVHDGQDNLVARNIAGRNGDDGIDVEEPLNALTKNRTDRNGDLGIEAVAGTIDGGKNRAFGNGNPLQCLNVECR